MPKAKPVYSSGSIPQLRSTLGCTIPEPAISTQPLCLQMLQPLPLHIKQDISISALGSVKGKKEGRYLILMSLPYISCAKWYSVCFKSANPTFLSTYNPST